MTVLKRSFWLVLTLSLIELFLGQVHSYIFWYETPFLKEGLPGHRTILIGMFAFGAAICSAIQLFNSIDDPTKWQVLADEAICKYKALRINYDDLADKYMKEKTK